MGVIEVDRRRDIVGIFELSNSLLQPNNSITQQLGPGPALAIIVLTRIWFLGATALLACRFIPVASLEIQYEDMDKKWARLMRITIFRFLNGTELMVR